VNVTLSIAGMTCGHCVKAVQKELGALPGVSALEVEVGRARFRTEGPPDEAAIRRAIDDAGYEVTAVATASTETAAE
jgi:copper chaperone